jgi:hypothetical protein
MMGTQSELLLASFDFVPVIAFLVGAYFLARIALLVRGRTCAVLAIAGLSLVFLGGFLKATWKLMTTTGGADIRWMSDGQFVLHAPGFLALLIAVIILLRNQKKAEASPLLAMAPWKIPFLVVMTLASLAAQGFLAYIAFRRKAFLAGIFFILAFLGLLAMGGLASGEQTISRQWLEESVNAFGQISFALGSFLLYTNYKANPC